MTGTATRAAHAAALLPASVLLFASFIGFDSIAQAGGEARRPGRDLPLAIFISVGVGRRSSTCCSPPRSITPCRGSTWPREALTRDVTAPGLLGVVLPPFWTVVIVSSASVALIKDLPAMLLGVSRLMFAWAEDGIFPARGGRRASALPHAARGDPAQRRHGDAWACIGCHLAGDWFLGVDILVTSMLVNFLLMAVSVLALPARNPALAAAVTVLPSRGAAGAGRGGRRVRAGAVPGRAHVEGSRPARPRGTSGRRRSGPS